MVELARLESAYTPKGYRGFESPSLRQMVKTHHEVVLTKKDRTASSSLEGGLFFGYAAGGSWVFTILGSPPLGERLAQRGNPLFAEALATLSCTIDIKTAG